MKKTRNKIIKKSPRISKKIKIGILGGNFNPPHKGHLESIRYIKEEFDLDKVVVIPSYKSPLKDPKDFLTPKHRLFMLKETFKNSSFVEIDDQEIKRKGFSYTYRSIENLAKKFPNAELFFIMGLDQFYKIHLWKNLPRLLDKSHLIIISRTGFAFPKDKKNLNKSIKPFIKKWSKSKVFLESGKNLYFVPLQNLDISSSQIRNRFKEISSSKKDYLNSNVIDYIEKNKLYIRENFQEKVDLDENEKNIIQFCLKEFENQRAIDTKVFHLNRFKNPFSFSIITSSSNTRHTKSLASNIQKSLKKKFKISPIGKDGENQGNWIALDYGDFVIHIFYSYTRSFYQLEEIWEKFL